MASLMENLIEVLEKENSEYEGLLELSKQKTPVIVSGNLEQLQKITDEEQRLVSRINQLEKKRTEVTADIANVLNKDVNNLKLTDLIKMLSGRPAEQTVLAEVHDRLQATVKGLRQINEQNKELLSNALEMIQFEMNLVQAMKQRRKLLITTEVHIVRATRWELPVRDLMRNSSLHPCEM